MWLGRLAVTVAMILCFCHAAAAETVTFDFSSAFNVDQLGTDSERLEALAVHGEDEGVDYTLYDIFGDHRRMGAMYDCYYVNNAYGLPTSGVISTAYGLYQLWPAAVGDVTTHQTSPNAIAFGKAFGPDLSPVTVTLPAAQRGRYIDVNFLVVHWYKEFRNGATADKRIRIYARYETGPDTLLYEGPVLGWNEAESSPFSQAHLSSRYIGSWGTSPRAVSVISGSRKLWQFAQPPAVDSTRTLVGFQLEGTEIEADAEDFALVFAGSGQRLAAPPSIDVTLSKDHDWCYQNTEQTTLDRHRVVLTVSVPQPDPLGNSTYTVEVTQTGGEGAVTIQPTADAMVWHLVGGRRDETSAGTVEIEVQVTGNELGGQGSATDVLTVRLLGDIDGGGSVGLVDKLNLNKWLNGLSTPYSDRAFDLNGDESVSLQDKLQLNRILNGLPLP